jgi:hypothetical protein
MPRESIFDPGGQQTEHSGSTFMGPRADNISHLPPDVSDGEVGEREKTDLEKLAQANGERDRERAQEG